MRHESCATNDNEIVIGSGKIPMRLLDIPWDCKSFVNVIRLSVLINFAAI